MAADPRDVRMARLEGAYEQIAGPLGAIESRLASVESRLASLESRMDARFNWVTGMMLTGWITTILAIFTHR